MIVVRILIASWLAAGWLAVAWSPTSAEGPLEIATIRTADFPYVRLYMAARDRAGNPVALKAGDLTITDSDERIPAASIQVGGAETIPVALVLLVDASDRDWIEPIGGLTGFDFLKRAGGAFLDSFPQGHQLQVIGYDKVQDANLALESTPGGPKARLQTMARHPRTWLYDRIDHSLDLLRRADKMDRRVLVVVADGNDVDSDITGQADYIGTLATKARSAGVNIFTIGSGPGVRDRLLRSLAEPTGGLFQLTSTEQLDRSFQRITDSLRLQTVVTYLAPCTGRGHRVTAESAALAAQATTQYEAGEAPPQLRLSGRRLSDDLHEVTVEAPQPRCPLRPPGVMLDLGAGGALEPDRQDGDRYFFLINAKERNLPGGRYLVRGVANNGMEGRSGEAYEFDWTCSPPWACGGGAAPILGLVVVALSLAGAGFMAKELRRPRAVDAYLEPYYERGGPMVWPEGTQFYLKTTTTIGRTGNADIPIPSRFKNIPGQALRLSARGKGDDLRFDVRVESEAVHVWIDRKPYAKENAVLREGNVLAIEGLSFRLLRREATQAWISAESAAP